MLLNRRAGVLDCMGTAKTSRNGSWTKPPIAAVVGRGGCLGKTLEVIRLIGQGVKTAVIAVRLHRLVPSGDLVEPALGR